MNEKYSDIISLAHHQSETRPHMSVYDRAAQFSPFAALTGHEEAINEAARATEERVGLDEYEADELDRKINLLTECISSEPSVTVVYFQADKKKSGGKYITVTGKLKRINTSAQLFEFTDGKQIPIRDISGIELIK